MYIVEINFMYIILSIQIVLYLFSFMYIVVEMDVKADDTG